jgi:hypothetical protein
MNAETLSAAPRPAASGYPIVLLLLCLLALLVLDSSLLSGGSPAHLPLRPLGSPGGGIVGGGTSLQPGLGKFAPLPGSDELSFNVIVTSTGRAELPVFMAAQLLELSVRIAAGGLFPGWDFLLPPVLQALMWPVITVLLLAPQRRAPDPDKHRPL